MKHFFLVLILFIGFSNVHAQSGATDYDAAYLRQAMESANLNADLGRLAQTKSASQKVKDYGKMLVNDYGRIHAELAALAKRTKTEPGAEHSNNATVASLEKKSGTEFDQAFMSLMLRRSEDAISSYRDETYKGKDPAVRNWAARQNPVLKKHFEWAKLISEKL